MRGAGPALALALALASLTSAAVAGPPASEPCFWIYGRLSAANGAPTFRIWRIGTKRVFGVVGEPDDPDNPALPPALKTLVSPDAFSVYIYGDYHVCPLHPDHPGWMRFVRVDQARRLIAQPHEAMTPSR